MSVAYALDVRAVAITRAGVVARDACRRGGHGEVAAVFERSWYLRLGEDFICIGEPAIGNGPATLIVATRFAELKLRQGQRAIVSNERIAISDLLLDVGRCETWRPPPWPNLPSPAVLRATCALLAARAANQSPTDSLAHALFAIADTAFARLARPRVAAFAASTSILRRARPLRGLSAPYGSVSDLVGLGPGLTPAGDDFLIGALAVLGALRQTNMHAALAQAIVVAANRTSPLSASLLRAAAAGHVGENLHTMVAALVTGDADAALNAAAGIGHTSGFDALAGAVMTARNVYRW
jgi:uncharacterized protein DUF2877